MKRKEKPVSFRLERVAGTVGGRSGSFVLKHSRTF